MKSGKVRFNLGDRDIHQGVKIETFTILRGFHRAFPSRIEITQNFILYHDLYYDAHYEKYINPINEDIVVEYHYQDLTYVRIRAHT